MNKIAVAVKFGGGKNKGNLKGYIYKIIFKETLENIRVRRKIMINIKY